MDNSVNQSETLRNELPKAASLAPIPAPRGMEDVLCLEDLEPAAKPYLPHVLYEFISGGVERNQSRAGNLDAFREIWLKPRMLHGVADRTSAVTIFGHTYDAPFGIAPMGAAALAAYRADTQMARAAQAQNIGFVLSGSSLIPLEEVAEANPNGWFQGYVGANRDEIGGLADRVWNAGFRTFLLTVDVPVGGNRENNVRAGFAHPIRPTPRLALDSLRHPKWLTNVWLKTLRKHGMPHQENLTAGRGIPIVSKTATRSHSRERLDWEDAKWLRDRWKGNLLVKGVLDPMDAKIAREIGFDGVVVSNHGGRQLDGSIAPLRALPDVLTERGDMKVLFDGGIRRGTDVCKAIALGADFVLVGRPMLYSAALGEQAGVDYAAALLKQEISRDMALLGCNNLSELEDRIIRPN